MDDFIVQKGRLMAEGVACERIAQAYGTPTYVYAQHTLLRHWHAFSKPLRNHPHLLCYSVKANSNLAVLQQFACWGAGFDVVSVGELERALMAGAQPNTIVFSGVGKQRHELERALSLGIKCFNVESLSELHQLDVLAQAMSVKAPVALRVNPNVDAKTHPYIATGLRESKFGLAMHEAMAIYRIAHQLSGIAVQGIACHIGSQITDLQPFEASLDALLGLVGALKAEGITLKHCDIGGGLGVRYQDEKPPLPADYIEAVLSKLPSDLALIIEPGRCIAANAGILLTRVLLLKEQSGKHFAVVDAAMNDLMRPALYQAWHDIVPVIEREGTKKMYDVVGPVCESGDFIGKDRCMCVEEGDLLAVRTTGAYGFTMSSQYNSRPRAAEIMVVGDAMHVIRSREQISDLYAREHLLP